MTKANHPNNRILLISSPSFENNWIQSCLKSEPVDLHCASSQDATLDAIKNNDIKLILLGITDSKNDSSVKIYELLENHISSERIPVIFIIPSYHEELFSDSIKRGAVDCIFRNTNEKEILARIKFYLNSNFKIQSETILKDSKRDFQIQQSQKMESIGLIAEGIAHDLNNNSRRNDRLCIFIEGKSQTIRRLSPCIGFDRKRK